MVGRITLEHCLAALLAAEDPQTDDLVTGLCCHQVENLGFPEIAEPLFYHQPWTYYTAMTDWDQSCSHSLSSLASSNSSRWSFTKTIWSASIMLPSLITSRKEGQKGKAHH